MNSTQFRIEVSDHDLHDLQFRLKNTRWAEDFENADWTFGPPETYLKELVDYWIDGFDWRAQEDSMNEFKHFRVTIDGIPLHFMMKEGHGEKRIPLILTHGWPWTFWDFEKVVRILSAEGDGAAFDLIVPSLPGFGFSSPLRRTGFGPVKVADLWVTLMTEVLGYERFGAHGGDIGATVTANLAHAHADKLIGAHLSLPVVLGAPRERSGRFAVTAADYGPDEAGWYERWTTRFEKVAVAHGVVHRASPQTLGWALNDSPIGLAAWILERRRNWSDCDGQIETAFSKDFLLTLVSIYWFTSTITTSMRAYTDARHDEWTPRHDRQPTMEAPTALAVFPQELMLLPRSFVEQYANLVHYSVMPHGGHFAAAEQPGLLAADLRSFFTMMTPPH